MSNETKPLTVDQILIKNNVLIDKSHRPIGYIKAAMEEYAAQQVAAALSEKTPEQRENEFIEQVKQFAIQRTEGSYDNAYLSALEAIRWGYACSAQQTAALREELERAKGRIDFYRDTSDRHAVTIEKLDKELKELKAEREIEIAAAVELRTELDAVKAKFGETKLAAEKYTMVYGLQKDELEAVKKERDEAIGTMNYFYKSDKEARAHCASIIAQRDEAVKLLREYERIIDYQGANSLPTSIISFSANVVAPFLSRLSSGETKPPEIPDSSPVSPWISVDDRLPESNGYYIAMAIFPYMEPGLIHFHKDTGWQNGFYKCSYWMPLPTPPESLTNKK